MIAVHVNESERAVVAEFFELFKTPWEFFHDGCRAEVVICSHAEIPETDARLVLIYSGKPIAFDVEKGIQSLAQNSPTRLACGSDSLPIYGCCVGFGPIAGAALKIESSGQPAMVKCAANGRMVVRIGYDLFQEIRHLLSTGQPAGSG